MANKIDPTNLSSEEYGSLLLQQKAQQEKEYAKQERKDRKIDKWVTTLTTLNDIGRMRAINNVNERISSSDPTIAREKAEIKKYNEEYDAQKGWRDAVNGIGLEGYAKQEADKFLKAGKYSNVAEDLAGLQTLNDDLYKQFVKDRDLVAKYKLQQYKANKISKGINEQEYLKNLTDWRTAPLKGNLFKDTAQLFGLNKDKAEMALEDLLDPNGVKYSEELIANKVGLEKLLSAKDENGNLIWNREEEERLREALVGFGDIAALRKIDETEKLQNVYNAFGTPITSKIKSVTEKTPYGTRQNVMYTNNDGSYQNIINGTVVPRTKQEIAKASEIVLAEIASELGEGNVTQEKIFNKFKKDHYDLYAKAYALKAIEFPKGYTIPTLSNDDKLMAEGAIVDLTTNLLGTSDTGFFKAFKETYLDPKELDTNQTILYDNFLSGVAESTKYYMGKGHASDKASLLAYREQLQGWEFSEASGFMSEDVWNYKRQAAGSLRGSSENNNEENQVLTNIRDNSLVPTGSSGGDQGSLNWGTQEQRVAFVNALSTNEDFMNQYFEADFNTKHRMLDAAARRHPSKVRPSMEDFVQIGESVRLLNGNKGYITWNGSQFEQSGVPAVFTGIMGGKHRQMTFDDVPEGPMKDLIREKAVDMYRYYATDVDQEVNVSDPDKLFKGSFHQEYGFIPAVVERWLAGAGPEGRAKHRNQPKMTKVDHLVDIAGYSFLGITKGDSALARQFLIDAMKDAMPTEEDRLVVAERQPPVYERPKLISSSAYNKVISLSNPFDKGIGITLDTIDFVGDIFGDGENEKRFMKRLVNYESDYGTSPLTFRTEGKDGRGLAQVSPIAFDEIQRRLSEGGKLAQYIPIVERETGIDITEIDYERDIHKPLHNIILMRLYLKIFPSQIPTSLADQGKYYKKYYNTHSKKAKGTPEGFILKNKNT